MSYTDAVKEAFTMAPSDVVVYHTLEVKHLKDLLPLTLVAAGTGMEVHNNNLAKRVSGGGTWSATAYSNESYVGGCLLKFKPRFNDKNLMVGINTDPQTSTSFTDIDYAIQCENTGLRKIYYNGVNQNITASYSANEEFVIEYDNDNIYFYQGGVLFHTEYLVGREIQFYLDSSFNTTDGEVYDLSFEPNPESIFLVQSRQDLTATIETGKQVVFEAAHFDFNLPPAGKGGAQGMQIAMSNYRNRVSNYLQDAASNDTPVIVIYRPFLNSDLTQPHLNPPLELALSEIDVGEMVVKGEANFDELVNKSAPTNLYDPNIFRTLGK